MAVTEFKEVHYDRGGNEDMDSSGATVRSYTRVFHAKTNTIADEAYVVLGYSQCPRVGDVHHKHLTAYCNSRDCQQGEGKKHWVVTCGYTTEREFADNPLNEPAKITWSTENYSKVCEKDQNGDGVVNSAGQYFDPPIEMDDHRLTATVSKNVATIPAWFLTSYPNSVNIAVFNLDGLVCPAKTVKLSAVALGDRQERNEIVYRVLTMTLHIDGNTWVKSVLDQGLMARKDCGGSGDVVGKLRHITCSGRPVTKPVPLDGAGCALWDSNPNFTPADVVYLDFDIYVARDFSVLPVT